MRVPRPWIGWRTAVAAVALARGPDAAVNAPEASPLGIVGIATPDGEQWTLGARGIGRPFSVRVVLGNQGATDLRVWRPDSADGVGLVEVVLTDSLGDSIPLRWAPKPRFGRPSPMLLKPHETAVYTLELLRADGIDSLRPGNYRLTAQYRVPASEDARTSGVWSGEAVSDTLNIRIVRPE
ncbi:MAG: hypothetical protein J0L84_07165 [Verrucomicrobia bacterium]|nr:hypothetical protein [Verrucomicrobiota bacterium]